MVVAASVFWGGETGVATRSCGDLDVLVFRMDSGVAGLESPPALPTGDVYDCCFHVCSGVAAPEWPPAVVEM